MNKSAEEVANQVATEQAVNKPLNPLAFLSKGEITRISHMPRVRANLSTPEFRSIEEASTGSDIPEEVLPLVSEKIRENVEKRLALYTECLEELGIDNSTPALASIAEQKLLRFRSITHAAGLSRQQKKDLFINLAQDKLSNPDWDKSLGDIFFVENAIAREKIALARRAQLRVLINEKLLSVHQAA